MRLRTSINLYVLETVLHLIGITPAAASVAAAAAMLPSGVGLLGGQGPPVIIDVVLLSGPAVPVASLVSAGLLALVFLLASPLLLGGVVRSLASTRDPGPGKLLVLGARRYPRFLLLHLVFIGLCAGGTVLLVWSAGPLPGAFASFALVATCSVLRDLGAVTLGREGRIRDCLSRIPSLLGRRPLLLLAGACLQAAVVWLLVLGALRLQLELHAETVPRAMLLGLLVQALVLARCVVRCAWLGALVHHDS